MTLLGDEGWYYVCEFGSPSQVGAMRSWAAARDWGTASSRYRPELRLTVYAGRSEATEVGDAARARGGRVISSGPVRP